MKIKVIGSILLVVAVTLIVGLLIYWNREDVHSGEALGPQKSEAFLRCENLVQEIKKLEQCDQKWALFQKEFEDCETFPPNPPDDSHFDFSTFRDVVFNIAECFTEANDPQMALKVYDHGLQFEDWTQEDHFSSYSAHFLLLRGKDLLMPSKNPICYTQETFLAQLKRFTSTANSHDLRAMLYSDQVLDTQVMGSDAGGYLSFQQWKDVFEENKPQYKMKYLKAVGDKCFVTVGWEKDFPWRGFCAERMGPQNCFYLTTIYAGIEATLADFEGFKTSQENP